MGTAVHGKYGEIMIMCATRRELLEGDRRGARLSGSVFKCRAQYEAFVDEMHGRVEQDGDQKGPWSRGKQFHFPVELFLAFLIIH